MTVFITNNHTINEKYFKEENEIKIKTNDNKNINIININNRFKYTNKIQDITIIEIKENEANIIDFFEFDDDNLFNNYNSKFIGQSIYILHFLDNFYIEKVAVSYGVLKSAFKEKNFNIIHYYCSENCLLGSPILNLTNYKVIGIHKQKCDKDYHLVSFLFNAIQDYIEKYNENKNKENKLLCNNKIIEEKYLDEITIKYKFGNDKKIRLFGYNFVVNNKQNCKIVVNGEEQELCEWLDISNIKSKKYLLEIKLKGINNIINMSYIFSNCTSLISCSNISKMNTIKIIDMSYIFHNCSSLLYLPDISNWKTSNVINMSGMFFNCSSLLSLPDISKWDTNKVNDMKSMFYQCSSLKSLPDISKWNTNNVNDMRCIFYYCLSLACIPDISKWKTDNVNDMSYMFCECSSLQVIPDISNWNTKNVIKINGMFSKCYSLSFLPDISKWNISNVKNMNCKFYDCINLVNIPF